MFWNRKIKCPIEEEDKSWIENNLAWINENVVNIENQPTILPTKKFFDWNFTGKEEDAAFVLRKVGEYFKINTDKIKLDFYSEEAVELDPGLFTQKEGGGTAGLYFQEGDEYEIWIEVQQLKKLQSMIATMAHELSHYVLIGLKNIYTDDDENEWLTDLTAIAYGFGIFIGNSTFSFSQWHSGDGWGGWRSSAQGYLPQQIIAYALAEIQHRKNEGKPEWIKLLNKNLQHDFERSMKYISAAK